MNISSIVIQTRAEYLEQVLMNLKNSGICNYHMHDDLKSEDIIYNGDLKKKIYKVLLNNSIKSQLNTNC